VTARSPQRVHHLPPRPRTPVVPNAVLAMLIFVAVEVMLFSGFVSAFTIMRGSAVIWPPPGQPRLPIAQTALNTLLLLASGAVLWLAHRRFRRSQASARTPLLVAILLGGGFVVLQGREWVGLLAQGLTLQSSSLGSFALGILIWTWRRLSRGSIPWTTLAAAEIFWYFVVGVWPVLYWRVYLT
jgi:heme/copper-type cytochrome/quinol oxidase subunit 3